MLTHKGTQPLDTERLTLRRITRDDARELFDSCFSLPEVTKYLRYETHRTIDDTYAIIDIWLKEYEKEDCYNWAVVLKETGKPIGTLTVVGQGYRNDACCELGFQLAEREWGNGYMTEAVKAAMAFLFAEVGFNRVEAYHSVNNPRSGAVLRRAGMQYEGMCREKYYCRLGYQDVHMYAMLKSELAGRVI